jgi:hypothetical protein
VAVAVSVGDYRDRLDRIRDEVLAVPTRRPELVQRGFAAVEAAGLQMAARAALRALLFSLVGAVLAGVIIILGVAGTLK